MIDTRNFTAEAILSIRPLSEFYGGSTYDSLVWVSEDQDKPTEAEFDTALASVKSKYDALEYARNRKEEYPPMEDQLDYIFHNGVDKWKEDIVQPVKDKYPKG